VAAEAAVGAQAVEAAEGGDHPGALASRVAVGEAAAQARHRLVEPLLVERLEQVVHRRDLEGAQGVAVVGGDEDDGGQVAVGELPQHLEAVEVRDLDVQEEGVDGVGGQRLHRPAAAVEAADDVDVGVLP